MDDKTEVGWWVDGGCVSDPRAYMVCVIAIQQIKNQKKKKNKQTHTHSIKSNYKLRFWTLM